MASNHGIHSPGSMDMHVFNIHAKMLQRFNGNDFAEPHELPGNTDPADFPVEQQMMGFHKSVDLLVVDDPAFLPQAIPHVTVTVTAELVLQGCLQSDNYRHIVKDLSMDIGCY
jgi:hypothetical protein